MLYKILRAHKVCSRQQQLLNNRTARGFGTWHEGLGPGTRVWDLAHRIAAPAWSCGGSVARRAG